MLSSVLRINDSNDSSSVKKIHTGLPEGHQATDLSRVSLYPCFGLGTSVHEHQATGHQKGHSSRLGHNKNRSVFFYN